MNKERLFWLDIAKGIAIILVVLGHTSIPMRLNSFIFTFHVPLFFIAAGMTNDFTKPMNLFLKRKARTLLLPFIIYSVIILIMRSFVSELSLGELTLNFLKEGWMGVPLWFVPVLFVALLVVRLTFEIKNITIRTVLWILIPLVSIDLCHFHIPLPWNMSVAPFAIALILIGHLCKEQITHNVASWLGGAICLFLAVVISQICRLDMCFNQVLPVTLKLIGAVAGTFMIFTLAYWIEKHLKYTSKVLQEIGKETYLILAFAEIIIVYMNFFFSLNALLKYAIMIVALYLLAIVRRLSRL